MNRRQKIIVSVVGIFLVLLILVGLTYAYFLTKIQGNTKSTSITVKTANLALVYGDGNGELTSASLLEPGKSFKFKNSNGEEYESKTFTVKNEGDTTTDYVVVIKDVVITDLATDSKTSFQSNDFRYTLTCTTDGTIACSGVENEVFPMSGGIVVGNEIEEGKTHTYTLTMEYLETGADQSNDMNKSLSAKIDIADIKEINPYSDKTTSLAYNIINNAKLNKNGTELKSVPDTIPAKESSSSYFETKTSNGTTENMGIMAYYSYWTYGSGYTFDEKTGTFGLTDVQSCSYNDTNCPEKLVGKYISYLPSSDMIFNMNNTNNLGVIYEIIETTVNSSNEVNLKYKAITPVELYSTEKTLNITKDDDGISYYYRGGVENNYVNFAGMCWRIVRIEGDGSTKLILEDINAKCNETSFTGNWGYDNIVFHSDYNSDFLNYSGGLADTFLTFQTEKLSEFTNKLKVDNWCYDNEFSNEYDEFQNFPTKTRIRLYNEKKASLICDVTKLNKFKDGTNMYVGTLTADEVAFAGVGISAVNSTKNYLMNKNKGWLLLTPAYMEAATRMIFSLNDKGKFTYGYEGNARPAITLATGTLIAGGDGTISNPYVVE